MKQPLGRIFFIILLSFPLFAAVKADVDRIAVYRGEQVTLTLSADGNNIVFPQPGDISGYPVEGTSSSRKISILNGHTTRTMEQRLQFTPTKDVTVPSLEITVDGKVEHTIPINIKVLEPQAAPTGAPIQLKMKLDRSEAFVGEPVRLDLTVRMKPGSKVDDLRINEPQMEDFWIKPINKEAVKNVDQDGYITRTYSYQIFAQKSGELSIPATFVQIGTRVRSRDRGMFGDAFFNSQFFGEQMEYKKIYSDAVALHVKALPDNLEVFGDFTLRSSIDKHKVTINKPVNLNIHIEGEGNVEDIPKFVPDMADAVVYSNEPVIKSYLKNGRYFGTFDQTIAIIPDHNITIEPVIFRYFDKNTKLPAAKQTLPYEIEVMGSVPSRSAASAVKSPVSIEYAPQALPVSSANHTATVCSIGDASAIYAAGVLSGAGLLWLFGLWRRERPKHSAKDTPMAVLIKKSESDKILFELLLPFKGTNPIIDDTLNMLEGNIYANAKHHVNKKAIMDYFNGKIDEEVELL